jgi:hypothetical protein
MSGPRTKLVAAATILGCSIGGAAMADDAAKPAAPAGPPVPAFADVLTAWGLTESGYVAASYYHSNGYNTYHQFDIQHDTFQLDQAALQLAYQPKQGFGALVNVAAGEDMRVLNGAEQGTGTSGSTFDIVQGFVQYAGGPMTVIAGKYVTLASAEVIPPTGNTNFSRSLLYFAEPLTHTGIRATYAASDTLSLIAGVNNGWNTTSTSYGSKTGEVAVAWTPNKIFALTAQAYIGKTPAFGYDAQRTLIDVVATYNATDSLTFILNYDWGSQEQHAAGLPNLDWNGAAAYVNYAFNDQWRLSVRAEYFDDKNGAAFLTGTAQTLKEGTVTIGYDPVKSFELRIEARYDKSNESTFVRSINGTSPPLADSQTEFALQGVFKF